MNKTWIIFEREYLQRVMKKSFILSTILTPLIFPVFITIAVFLIGNDDDEKVISLIDEKKLISDTLSIGNNLIVPTNSDLETLQPLVTSGEIYGVLTIPDLDIYKPKGINFYSKNIPSNDFINELEDILEKIIRDKKILELELDKESLDKLDTRISMNTFSVEENLSSDSSEIDVKKSNSGLAFGLGYFNGFFNRIFERVAGVLSLKNLVTEENLNQNSEDSLKITKKSFSLFKMPFSKNI